MVGDKPLMQREELGANAARAQLGAGVRAGRSYRAAAEHVSNFPRLPPLIPLPRRLT